MALSARDLYFAVRVEDRATRPLRRIAADFRNLGRAGLTARQAQVDSAKLSQARAAASTRAARAELASVQTGSKRLALDLRQATAVERTYRARLSEVGALNKARAQYDAIQRAETKAAKLSQLPAKAPIFRGLNAAQVRNMKGEAQSALETARRNYALTAQQVGLATGQIDRAILAERQLIAVEAERIAREAELQQIILSRAEAEKIATRRVLEAQAAVHSYPVERLQAAGRIVSHLGRVLTTAGAVGVAAFAFLAKGAADFNTQVTLAATQSTVLTKNTPQQVAKNATVIQNAIQKMLAGGKVIAHPEEQTAAIYKIFSGVTLKGNQLSQLHQGISLLKEFNRVTTANAGLVTLEESTKAGITLINRFGYSASNIRGGLNIMQAAVRYGDITMSEFINTMSQAAPAAQAAGYSLTDMSAAIAFVSRQFPNLRQGATGYARLVETLGRKEVITGLKQHGVAITSMAGGYQHLLPIQTIAKNIIDKFGGSVTKGTVFVQNFFKTIANQQGTIQARKVLESYLHRLGLATTILKQVKSDHNELQKSLIAAQKSPGVRWQEFANQMHGLALEIGTGVIPAVALLADHVRRLAGWFNNLSPHTKQAIGYIGALVAVVTLLSGILFVTIGGITSLVLAISPAVKFLGLMKAEAAFSTVEFSALFGVLGIAIYVLYRYPQILNKITHALGGTKNAVELLVTALAVGAISSKLGLFANIEKQAAAAGIAAGALRTTLFKLGAIGLITIGINLVFSKSGDKSAMGMVKKFAGGVAVGAGAALLVGADALTGGAAGGAAVAGALAGRAFKNQFFNAKTGVPTNVPIPTPTLGQTRRRVAQEFLTKGIIYVSGPNGTIDVLDMKTMRKIRSYSPLDMSLAATTARSRAKESPAQQAKEINKWLKEIAASKATQSLNNANRAAASLGTTNTKAFKAAYDNFIAASKYAAAHPKDYQAQLRAQNASEALQTLASKQQLAAAKKVANALSKNQQKYSDDFIKNEAKRVAELSKAARNTKTFAAWKAYYAALSKLQGDATDAQLSAVEKLFNLTDSAADKSAAKTKQRVNKLKQEFQQVVQNLENMYQTFDSQNQNLFGQLFQGPHIQSAVVQDNLNFGLQLKPSDLLKDLKSQLTRFRSIRGEIGDLAKKGLPQSLLNQIEQLGPEEAQKQLTLLNKMTPAQIKEYKRIWNEGQKEVHRATMNDLNNQLDSWRKHGKRIALAIAAGLRDENTALESSLKALILKAFPSLKGGAGQRTTPRGTHSTGTKGPAKTEHHVHYHVTAPKSEHPSIKKQLGDANWHHRVTKK